MSKKTFETTCFSLDDFGRGIIRVDNTTCFVDNLLPSEKAIVTTIFEYGKLKETILEKRLNDSKDRVKVDCPYYPSCGGCQLRHLSYPAQLEYKRQKVKYLLHKFASLDIDVEKTIGLSNPFNFRNKVQKPIRLDKKTKKPIAGFYKKDSHDLISIKYCLNESDLSNKITNTLLELFIKYHYTPYDEDKRTGLIRNILIKTSSNQQEALVTLISSSDKLNGKTSFAKDLIKIHPEVKGVILNINKRDTNVILGEKEIPIYGYKRIKDKIFDNEFLISSKSFYQTNSKQIETLYKTAIDLANLSKEDKVLDAYCGTGTIGLSLANKVKKVTGVEIVKEAIHDAIINAKINNITNCHFILKDCTEYLLTTEEKYDVIFLDPPRKGSTKEFLNACIKMKPKKIIYVSCDPVTLSRDLNILKSSYQIEKVIPVDMFPNTTHVETVVAMTIKNAD